MAAGRVPKRADWRVADGVRVEELDGSWLALDPAGGIVYRLEARAAEVMRLVANRLPLPGHLVPAARELAGHGVLEHPLVDRRTALVGAGVVTLTGLAATILPSAVSAASNVWDLAGGQWPVTGGTASVYTQTNVDIGNGQTRNYYVHEFTASKAATDLETTLRVIDGAAITDVSILIVAGGGGGGRGQGGAGGGGGAGGVLEVTGAQLSNGYYDVTIGSGGLGRAAEGSGRGASGANSRLSLGSENPIVDLQAVGGGGGGGPDGNGSASPGGSGGGGGADEGSGDTITGGGVATGDRLSTILAGTASFSGSKGGDGANADTGLSGRRRAGGGGGAGGAGVSGVEGGQRGDGGLAITLSKYVTASITSGAFAGGGGGAGGAGSPLGAEGRGGGASAGDGGYGDAGTGGGDDADPNTGSGGGGSTQSVRGGNGGSGIILVRYRLL